MNCPLTLGWYTTINQRKGDMIMITLEQVEKLSEVTGVTYNEAKDVLEQTQGDLLEAVLLLERQGKVKKPNNDGFTTSQKQSEKPKKQPKEEKDSFQKFFDWVKEIIHLGNINDFVVYKDAKDSISVPLTIFVILLLFAFWIVFPLMVVGLFFNYRYRFAGPNFKDEKVNQTVDSISNATIKTGAAIKDAVNNFSKDLKKEDQHDQDSAD